MGHRLLLVDHGSGAAERLCEQLGRAGHEAVRVAGMVAALTAIERMRPHLVLIDEGGAEAAITDLCAELRSREVECRTPVILLADHVSRVVDEPAQRARRIGCDRVLDSNIPGDELIAICAELLARPTPTARMAPPPQAAFGAPAKDANRDAPSAESFAAATESALLGSSTTIDDGGGDIEAHLDSLFASTGKTAAASAARTPGSPKTSTEPVLPRVPPRPTPESQAASPTPPRPAGTPSRQAAAPAPHATTAAAAPAGPTARPAAPPATAPSKPAPIAVRNERQQAPTARPSPGDVAAHALAAAGDPPPAPSKTTATVREAPRAVVHLRQPRAAAPSPKEPEPRSLPRWLLVAGAGVVVAVPSIWFVFFSRPAPAPVTSVPPQVVARVAPQTAPVPVTESPALPSPPPLGESTTDIDFAAPTVPPEPAAQAPPEPAKPARKPTPAPGPAATATQPTSARPAVAEVRPVPAPAARETQAAAVAETVPAPAKRTPAEAAPSPAPASAAKSREVLPATPPPRPEARSETPADLKIASPVAVATVAAPAAPAPVKPDTSSAEASPVIANPPDPANAVPVVVPPEVVERVAPVYSASAVKKVNDPVVVLRVLVDEQGRIGRVVVDQGIPGSELEAAAISAVLRWRFRPGTENGVPVKAWTSARFVFER